MNLFDERFSWMQPSPWQLFYGACRRLIGDRFSGSTMLIDGLPYRVKRVRTATSLELWADGASVTGSGVNFS